MQTEISSHESFPLADTGVPQIIHLILGILAQAEQLGATRIRMEPLGDLLSIELSASSRSSVTNAVLDKLNVRGELIKPLYSTILERSYFWPDIGDDLFTTNQGTQRRILLSPLSGEQVVGDLILQQDPRSSNGSLLKGSTLILDNLQRVHSGSLLNLLDPHEPIKEALQLAVVRQNGLLLAQRSSQPHQIDACGILLALRSNALFYPRVDSPEIAAAALSQSATDLVVVGLPANDPVELIANFLRIASVDSGLIDRFVARFAGAYVHTRARRICAKCSKETPVRDAVLDRLPHLILGSRELTHRIGTGCSECRGTGLRGTIGLDSFVAMNSWLKRTVRSAAGAEQLAEIAYQHGPYRSLLENGLVRVANGVTSCDAVLEVASHIPPHLAAALLSGPLGIYEPPSESAVRELIGSFGSLPPTPRVAPDQQRRLLIVEDDSGQRKILNTIFASAGYEVIEANNGKVALDILERSGVDLIVCDLMMPEMTGEQFISQLRENNDRATTPVLMLTAVSEPDAEFTLLTRGADDYCNKNVTRRVLLSRVDRLLSRTTDSEQ